VGTHGSDMDICTSLILSTFPLTAEATQRAAEQEKAEKD